jgi:chromosome segregation ATPase
MAPITYLIIALLQSVFIYVLYRRTERKSTAIESQISHYKTEIKRAKAREEQILQELYKEKERIQSMSESVLEYERKLNKTEQSWQLNMTKEVLRRETIETQLKAANSQLEDKKKYIELLHARHVNQINEIKMSHKTQISNLETQVSSKDSKIASLQKSLEETKMELDQMSFNTSAEPETAALKQEVFEKQLKIDELEGKLLEISQSSKPAMSTRLSVAKSVRHSDVLSIAYGAGKMDEDKENVRNSIAGSTSVGCAIIQKGISREALLKLKMLDYQAWAKKSGYKFKANTKAQMAGEILDALQLNIPLRAK